MKKMSEKKMSKNVIAVIVTALILGGGALTAALLSAGTGDAGVKEAKAVQAGIEKIAGEIAENAVKETKKEAAKEKEENPEAEEAGKATADSNKTNRTNSASSSGYSYHSVGSNASGKVAGSSGTNTSAAPSHTHNWTAVYKTVTVPVEKSKWTRLCNACRIENPSLDHLADHAYNFEVSATHTETIYWTEYVEEQQLSHYQCSCGATK